MKKRIFSISLILLIVFGFVFTFQFFNKNKEAKVIKYSGNNLMVTVDGNIVDSLPSSGSYYLESYSCNSENTKVSWDMNNYKLSVTNGSNEGGIACDLTFSSKPLLNTMKVGDYVSYVGSGGTVGTSSIKCDNKDVCSGKSNDRNSLVGSGFRIAYIKDKKVKLVSADVFEISKEIDVGKVMNELNTSALKFCNENFVDDGCYCDDNNKDGLCDKVSSDIWSISEEDFGYIINGKSDKKLSFNDCKNNFSNYYCGWHDDLIDIGKSNYTFTRVIFNEDNNDICCYGGNSGWIECGKTCSSNNYRPIVNLSATVYVTGGVGTVDAPYTIANN